MSTVAYITFFLIIATAIVYLLRNWKFVKKFPTLGILYCVGNVSVVVILFHVGVLIILLVLLFFQ